ncbi:hypothetical protein FDR72_05500 [Campylobacter helveticus]|uniref:hypothetical protein n=1 Tax=Campylobacter helveticus TaxID=28898 RepID=UPI001112BAF2|nr:hypothetical protein [Campylobacter helveticus]TNB60563.1 hypothetical protein FDR72_05500 [Campylobacter helveticus]
MMLSFFIFILNAFLLFFSVDFDALDTVKEQIKLSLFFSILLLSLVSFIAFFKKKRFLQKIFYKISLLEKNEDVEKALDSLKEHLETQNYRIKKANLEKGETLFLLEELYYHLGNIQNALYYIEADEKTLSLLLNALHKQKETLRLAINHPIGYNKSLGGRKDKFLRYEAKVALINNDDLENFLIQNILAYFGIQSIFFKELSFDRNDYHLIFVKDEIYQKLDKKDEDFIVFGRDKNLNYPCFLTMPLDKKMLELILKKRLEKLTPKKFEKGVLNNVLLFKQNEFDANLFFSIIEKQCSQNTLVHSLSKLKECLSKESYRLVLLDYEVIKFDLEQIKILLHIYKNHNPQSHIILFTKEKITEFECISEVLSSISKNELIALLRKYLS